MMARIFALLLLAALTPQMAGAREWVYCVAPSHADHKLYMSRVFSSRKPAANAEAAFAAVLKQSFLRYTDVQCPWTRDEFSAQKMQRHTIAYNRELGVTIINMKWKP